MNTRSAFLLGAALSLGVAGELAAQTGSSTGTQQQGTSAQQGSSTSQEGTQTITGTVVSSSGSWLVVRGDNGSERTFAVSSQSSLPSGLAAGSRVTVRYQTLGDGRYQAQTVAMESGSGSTTGTSSIAPSSTAGTSISAATGSTTGTASGTTADDAATRSGRTADGAESLPATAGETPALALAGLVGVVLGLLLLALSRRRTA
jgi:LPXTG-motif cell wall-anchored protein